MKRTVTTLAKHPAIQAVAGYGSFFEGNCLYGVSDIDFVFLLDERFSRADAAHHEIAFLYNRLRRIFRFLAPWSESAENLLFLSEMKAGFPPPASITLRAKQQRLQWLHGAPPPALLAQDTVNLSEIAAEIDTLLRIALMKGEAQARKQLLWKRLFKKLLELATLAGLSRMAAEMQSHPACKFLQESDRLAYLRPSDPDALFALMLEFAQRICQTLRQRERTVDLEYRVLNTDGQASESGGLDVNGPTSATARAIRDHYKEARFQTLPSALYGLTPRFRYLPLDRSFLAVDMDGGSYNVLRSIARLLDESGEEGESVLVRLRDFLFLLSKLPSHVDIMPLNPLLSANLYARLSEEPRRFSLLSSIYQEQREIAGNMFSAFAHIYKKSAGWIEKLRFPCVYAEDDLIVIQDAWHRMRVFLLHSDHVDIGSSRALVEYLSDKYPSCRAFLGDLLTYYESLLTSANPRAPVNTLYRCLLQFMAQLLSGAAHIELDGYQTRLGITVGIITRNRAADLRDVLESLTRQLRPADEVLIVDNGSTDDTKKVIESFQARLPISHHFLPDASIPNARNMVVDRAQHEIIAFTDDDCIVEPEWLDAVERGFLRADNVGIVGGWVKHEPAVEPSLLDTYYSLFHHNKS